MKLLRIFPGLDRHLLALSHALGRLFVFLGIEQRVGLKEVVSRHVFDPPMGSDLSALIAKEVFQFQERHGFCESLVWRAYAPDLMCVHSIGCMREAALQTDGRAKKYVGAISSNVEKISNFKNVNGHGFKIYHAPSEGIHHIHITLAPAGTAPLTKSDKSEMKIALQRIFADRSEHSCAAKFSPKTPSSV